LGHSLRSPSLVLQLKLGQTVFAVPLSRRLSLHFQAISVGDIRAPVTANHVAAVLTHKTVLIPLTRSVIFTAVLFGRFFGHAFLNLASIPAWSTLLWLFRSRSGRGRTFLFLLFGLIRLRLRREEILYKLSSLLIPLLPPIHTNVLGFLNGNFLAFLWLLWSLSLLTQRKLVRSEFKHF